MSDTEYFVIMSDVIKSFDCIFLFMIKNFVLIRNGGKGEIFTK